MLQFKDPKKELPAFNEQVLVKYSVFGIVFYRMCYLVDYTPVVKINDGNNKPSLVYEKKPCFMIWFGEAKEHLTIEQVRGWMYKKDLEEIPIK